jgi:DNA-directed RNA polymerase specialized sigma24 family protein
MQEDNRRKNFNKRSSPHLSALQMVALWLTQDSSDSIKLVKITLTRGYSILHPSISKANLKVMLFKILTSAFFNGFQQKTKISMDDKRHPIGIGARRSRFTLLNKEADRVGQRTIVRLPVEIQYVKVLSEQAGFSNLEIAKIIGLNPNVIESIPFRGSRRLQNQPFNYGEG